MWSKTVVSVRDRIASSVLFSRTVAACHHRPDVHSGSAVPAQSSRRAPLPNLALAQRSGECPQLELVGIERDKGFSLPSGLVLL